MRLLLLTLFNVKNQRFAPVRTLLRTVARELLRLRTVRRAHALASAAVLPQELLTFLAAGLLAHVHAGVWHTCR